ncbi:EnvZ/OmpR regulon moderator MzrA [Serratia rhizosphaerae]|uniref:EnvZ/OmpR regulon moderator MzrA n=1 Tax=unclassified Serratia (in: enterobacteria) TaxID=2647522 RepID=UPI000CF74421|nr:MULTISPECIES: EnvZ/OmpR regulon moderator MzrA [unclassified Serratia (in: enterobacteria)]MBU3893869.1 EnvZ/OmpR regulon moderator MzrA [Serratia rubidaea]AVJ19409.1 modulator protein [Serratia sp. MYb239]MCA4825554.1 EnvZ/OmpR regulon moderator MzrA [Serratia rubidaea]QNK32988.1 EnvZ/OmpR regulon moderator MzrA [Serratia sp. JUb9]CAE1150501.1 Modulator protein MzrA [Serratia sp. Tan611]
MTTPRSRWQYALIIALALLALSVFFLPAMVRTETELRIRSTQQGLSLPDGFYVYQRLDARGIRIKSITPEGDGLVIRLDSPQQQLLARETLQAILPPGYTIALSELPAPSHWIRKLVSSTPQDLG